MTGRKQTPLNVGGALSSYPDRQGISWPLPVDAKLEDLLKAARSVGERPAAARSSQRLSPWLTSVATNSADCFVTTVWLESATSCNPPIHPTFLSNSLNMAQALAGRGYDDSESWEGRPQVSEGESKLPRGPDILETERTVRSRELFGKGALEGRRHWPDRGAADAGWGAVVSAATVQSWPTVAALALVVCSLIWVALGLQSRPWKSSLPELA